MAKKQSHAGSTHKVLWWYGLRRFDLVKPDDEIRSTEKLLKLIRSSNPIPLPADDKSFVENQSKPIAKSLIASLSFQKRVTIGVDIGHTHIKLAKVLRSDKNIELIDFLDIPFNTTVSVHETRILKTLKSALDQFCEGTSCYDIWAAIQSANVVTHCIRIPKLPRKQVSNAIFWTFTKKTPFDKNLEILDYEILGDISETGIKKTQVLVLKAPKDEINTLKSTFQKIGYPLKGISIAPFAIQNLFRAKIIAHPEKDTCCLFIGRDWSRIAIYSQGNLVLSRGIKAGMRSMVDAINIALQREEGWDRNPQQSNTQAEDEFEHSTMAINPKAQKLFFDFIGIPQCEAGKSSSSGNVDLAHIFQMVVPALERLIRQVERTFEHYALNFNAEGIKRIFISGQIIANPAIVDHFGKQLDLPVIPMNPFPPETYFTRDIRIPEKDSEKESYVPAIGLALSSNAMTPNFLFTHEDKNIVDSVRRTNMRILTGCMLCLIVMIGFFSWQQNQLGKKRQKIDKLDNQLMVYNPPVGKNLLLGLYAKTTHKHQVLAELVHRYLPVAVISEISRITPSNIRLLSIDADFAQHSLKTIKPGHGMVTVEGIVFGDTGTFETSLTSYLLSLKNSGMFQKPNIQSKEIEYYGGKEVLRFTTKLEII